MAIAVKVISDSAAAREDLSKLKTSVASIEDTAKSVTKTFKDMAIAISASVVSVASVSSLIQFSDGMKSLSSRLKVTTRDNVEFNKALLSTRKIAVETGAALEDITQLYSKISSSAEELNASQSEVATVVGNVAKAIAIGNASVNETSAAVTQLAQALGSGRLQGDELRSILENSQPLARMIAEGLGVSIAQMRKLGTEGMLTSETVFNAILSQTDAINDKFGMMEKTFSKAFTKLGTSFKVLGASALTSFNVFNNAQEEGGFLGFIENLAKSINAFASNLEAKIVMADIKLFLFTIKARKYLNELKKEFDDTFGKTFESFLKGFDGLSGKIGTAFDKVKFTISQAFNNINVNKIDVTKFIPNLGPMADFVWAWARKVERAFFWIFDEVIDHSWIPDLVEGTAEWLEKLNDGPLKSVNNFATKVSEIFERLMNKLLEVPFIRDFTTSINKMLDKLGNTRLSHDLKQLFGIKDKFAGNYSNRNHPLGLAAYDTEAFVGRGPARNKENRPFMHDFINVLNTEKQIPFIASVANTFGAGIITAVASGSVVKGVAAMLAAGFASFGSLPFSNFAPIGIAIGGSIVAALTGGPLGKVLSLLLSGALATGIAKTVDKKEILTTADETVKTLWGGLNKGIELLFGSGIFGDKGFGMFLLTAAKIAMLFRGGRDIMMRGITALATSPVNAANFATTRMDQALVARQLERNRERVNNLQASMQQQRATLQRNGIGAQQIAGIMAARRDELQALRNSQATLNRMDQTLRDRVFETRGAVRQGLVNGTVGAGGALGGIAGFMFGAKILEGMQDAPAWKQIGVQMGAGFLGQALGAALGLGITRAVLLAAATFTTPVAAAISAAVITGLALYSGTFEKVVNVARDLFNAIFDKMSNLTDKLLKSLGLKSIDPEANANARKEVRAADEFANEVKAALKEGTITKEEADVYLKNTANKQAENLSQLSNFNIFDVKMKFENALVAAVNILQGKTELLSDNHQKIAEVQYKLKDAIFEVSSNLFQLANIIKNLKEGKFADLLTAISGKAVASEKDPRSSSGKIINMRDPELGNEGRVTRSAISVPKLLSEYEERFEILVAALTSVESGGNDKAVSPAGAKGRMQLMPRTFSEMANKLNIQNADINNPEHNIAAGRAYLRSFYDKYEGDIRKAAASYIGGPLGVRKDGSLRDDVTDLPNGKGNSPLTYANKVEERFEKLMKASGKDYFPPDKLVLKDFTFDGNDLVEKQTTDFSSEPGWVSTLKGLAAKLPWGLSSMANNALDAFGKKDDEQQIPVFNTLADSVRDANIATSQLEVVMHEALMNMSAPEPIKGLVEKSYYDESPFQTLNEQMQKFNMGKINPKDLEFMNEHALELEEGILSLFDGLNDLIDVMNDATTTSAEKAKAVKKYQITYKKIEKDLATMMPSRELDAKKQRPSDIVEGAATTYIKGLKSSLTGTLSAALKDPSSFSGKTFFKGIATQFTQSITDGIATVLVNGLMDNSGLTGLMDKLVKGTLFEFEKVGNKTGSSLGEGFDSFKSIFSSDKKKPETEAVVEGAAEAEIAVVSLWDRFKAAGSDAFETVTGGLLKLGQHLIQLFQNSSFGKGVDQAVTGAGEWLSTAFGAVKTWAGYATGGYVSGPGTGTSDSIPAMLSNGEYVINAEAAAKFKPILDAINTGQFGKFSEGGGVGDFGAGASSFNTGTFGAGFMDSISGFNFTSFTTSISNSIGDLSSSVDGVSNGFYTFTDAQKSFFQTSNSVLGNGFNEVGKGMFNMGQLMQSGFMAVGLAMVNMQKPGKFNYVGAALTIASAAFGVYNAAGAAAAPKMQGGYSLNTATPQTTMMAAEGGYISGPGTATSDSIPAMLSNGEFVVRASAVDKWRPLLEAINSGRPAKFSDGGIVEASATMSTLKDGFKTSSASNGASTQTFNINVTGDVSRQTRREIQEMIPVIAVGVNSHNSERGKSK